MPCKTKSRVSPCGHLGHPQTSPIPFKIMKKTVFVKNSVFSFSQFSRWFRENWSKDKHETPHFFVFRTSDYDMFLKPAKLVLSMYQAL